MNVVPTLLCGGTENQFMTLARSLDERFNVRFACLRRWGPFAEELSDRGIPLEEYRVKTFRSLNALRQQVRFARDVRRLRCHERVLVDDDLSALHLANVLRGQIAALGGFHRIRKRTAEARRARRSEENRGEQKNKNWRCSAAAHLASATSELLRAHKPYQILSSDLRALRASGVFLRTGR